tara:strand:+ start:516 stop:1043 length:528 start_codon:yes stop_codon:yes gene_type:complete
MSEKFIPENVDPFRFAEQDLHLDGVAKLVDMHRLNVNRPKVSDDERVAVNLHFGVDEQGVSYVKGHLQANLGLQCQRCLETFTYEIISDFALGLIKALDEDKSLPVQYEPAMVREGQLALRDLIEDELILNLPIIPRHESESCNVKLPLAADSAWEQAKGDNPFQVLQTLKQKQK